MLQDVPSPPTQTALIVLPIAWDKSTSSVGPHRSFSYSSSSRSFDKTKSSKFHHYTETSLSPQTIRAGLGVSHQPYMSKASTKGSSLRRRITFTASISLPTRQAQVSWMSCTFRYNFFVTHNSPQSMLFFRSDSGGSSGSSGIWRNSNSNASCRPSSPGPSPGTAAWKVAVVLALDVGNPR